MLKSHWVLNLFCASAIGGDALSERWANIVDCAFHLRANMGGPRRGFPQLLWRPLGEPLGSLGGILGLFWDGLEPTWGL